MNSSNEEKYQAALDYAIGVIENYEMDIINAEEMVGINLAEKGFCQGRFYKNAIAAIERRSPNGN